MTTPPDFGGSEIEEGLREDLGAPPDTSAARVGDRDDAVLADHEAHAPGEVCQACGARITAGQDVRRRPGGWVHEVCP